MRSRTVPSIPASGARPFRHGLSRRRGKSRIRRFLTPLLLAVPLIATPAEGELLVGAKLGTMTVDTPSRSNPVNLALNLGYEIDTLLANLSLVGEINRTVSNGETNDEEALKFSSDGIYIVYKTNRALFVTLRGGVVQDKIITDAATDRNVGLAFGGGFGGVTGRIRIQFEYTTIAGDADYVSIGLEY